MLKSIGLAVATGAALLVVAAACGGSSTPAPSSTSTSTVPATTAPTTAAPTTASTTPGTTVPTTVAPSTVAPSTTVAGGALNSTVLAPSQVTQLGGTLVSQQTAPGGTTLATATLDICATVPSSEHLRIARYQVDYLDGNGATSAANEVVRYSTGGATQAYQQLHASIAASCTPTSGLSQLTAAPVDPKLATQQVIITAEVTSSGGGSTWTAAVYQFKGDYLSAVYVFRPAKAQALQVAEAIAGGALTKLTAVAS